MDQQGKHFEIVNLDRLEWPLSLHLPSRRFRLFVAADTSDIGSAAIKEFARAALKQGMVYFCAWGPDCSRFHDLVDQTIVDDDLGQREFAGLNESDTIMTTWHENETLEEALDYFATLAAPTDGFMPDSGFRLVICLDNPDWTVIATQFLQSVEFFA